MSNSPNSPTVRLQEDHEGLQVVPDDGLQTPDPEESPMDKDIKFQPYSAGAIEDSPPPESLKQKRICGMRKWFFWFLILLLFLAIIGLAIGLGVGLSNSNSASSSSPTPSSSTSSSTGTTISSAAPSTTSPVGQTCVNGTGPGNYLGLCNFSCNFGYCPSPCTCLQFSTTAIPAPPITNTPGFPLPGENADYTGLCSFTCNHGYCPEGACTTDSSAAGGRNSSVTTAAAVVSTPSSGSSSLPGSSVELLTLTPPTSTVVVTLLGSVTSTVVVGPSSTG